MIISISNIEAAKLTELAEQFMDLLDSTTIPRSDEAVARLVPNAYRDDDAAADEFRSLTEGDLLARRVEDAKVLVETLRNAAAKFDAEPQSESLVELDRAQATSWLKTIAAIRLVLATRLEITDEDYDSEDPKYMIYDWLAYRLDQVTTALD